MTTLGDLAPSGLTIPAIAAPMTGVSSPALVAAASAAGVIGAFPTTNCSSTAELDEWLDRIEQEVAARLTAVPRAPVAANLIVRRGNDRLDADIACILKHGIDFVITSVGNPAPVIGGLHAAGCRVLADVASLAHAEKALDAGADGLVLLSAGAGGHPGSANPFAFARAVRRFYDGVLVMAGGISDGTALWAAITLGYDLGYLGTKLIATDESAASPEWRQAVVEASLDDVELSIAPNGLPANLLKTVGGAGHSVSGVEAMLSVRAVIERTTREWNEARDRSRRALA